MFKPEPVSCEHCFMEPRCWPEHAPDGSAVHVERRPPIYPGTTLWRHGTAFTGLYMVRNGCIKVMETDETGGDRVLSFAFAGDMIGLEALASGRHETTAVALTEAMVCFLPWPLRGEAGAEGALPLRLLQRASTLLQQRSRAIRLADPDLSVQRFLKEIAARIGRVEQSGGAPAIRLRLPMSRMEIGQYLGYAEETVCRSMHRLRRQGEIEVSGRTLLLKSKAGAPRSAALPALAAAPAPVRARSADSTLA
jgi:CRP/FNR family transcriptional regulator, anaerobic regulatory protein